MSILKQKLNIFAYAVFAVILALFFVGGVEALSNFSVSKKANAVSASGNWIDYTEYVNTDSAEISITKPEQLAYIAQIVNNGASLEGKTLKIYTMDLGAHCWTPIGIYGRPFKGNVIAETTATISNLTIDSSILGDTNAFGLFGYVESTSTGQGFFSNFVLSNINININSTITNNDIYVGGVAGYYNGSRQAGGTNTRSCSDISVNGNINFDGLNYDAGSSCYVGGVFGQTGVNAYVGWLNGGSVNVSINTDDLNKTNFFAGGVIGDNNGTLDGNTAESSTAKHLNLTANLTPKYGNWGIVAGRNSKTIQNVNTQGSIIYSNYSSAEILAGGIAGVNIATATISNVQNSANIQFSGHSFGGIVGYNMGTINTAINSGTIEILAENNFNVGGIVAQNIAGATIKNSSNSGSIFSQITFTNDLGYAGGVAGQNAGTITSCNNTAQIGYGFDAEYVGGIAGLNAGTINTESTNYTYNTGNIRGLHAGGIVGENNTSSTALIENSYNTGNVIGNDSAISRVGGIVGNIQSGTSNIKNCFNLGEIGSLNTYNAGGLVGYSFSSAENCIIKTSISTGYILDAGGASGSATLGGLIGYIQGTAPTLTDCVYDKSKANYNENLASRDNGLKVLGNGTTLSNDFKSISYNLTKPGATTATNKISAFVNNDKWYFAENNENIYYYPVLSNFNDAGVFDNTDLNKIAYPSVRIYQVNIKNHRPYWNETTQQKDFYTDETIETFISGAPEYFAGGVQYVVAGQKLVMPANTQYTTPTGFTEFWRSGNSSDTAPEFDFNNQAISADTDIYLTWTEKEYNIIYKINDSDKGVDGYFDSTSTEYPANLLTTTITYSLDPNAFAEIPAISIEGKDFSGWWRSEDDANENKDTATLLISQNADYSSGLILYGKLNPVTIQLTLNAGVMGVGQPVQFSGGGMTKTISVTYGQPYELLTLAPFGDLTGSGYVFKGYYNDDGSERFTESNGTLINSPFTTDTTIYAFWTEKNKTVKFVYYDALNDVETDLTQITVEFASLIVDEFIPTDNDINYSQVDNTKSPNGYKIADFYADKENTEKFEFNYQKIEENTTIYVAFVKNTFTITLNANGGSFSGGVGGTTIISDVPYDTDLVENYLNQYVVRPTRVGFSLFELNGVPVWSSQPILDGADFNYNTNEFIIKTGFKMPANDLEIFAIWQRGNGVLILDANGGQFAE
ncbi:MAG: hypothetical protein J6C13_03250, partial [Clostridia bacterium]|nr:hypothetical protein [Clostridia bacterium]